MHVLNTNYINANIASMKLLSAWLLVLTGGAVWGQTVHHHIDTLPTGHGQTQVFMHVDIPSGQVFLKSSQHCGTSFAKFSTPDRNVRPHVVSTVDQYGNLSRKMTLLYPESQNEAINSKLTANMRLSRRLLRFDEDEATPQKYMTEYRVDPSIPTDLKLNLNVGASRMDFTEMALRNVDIRSVFSDVLIDYKGPNPIEMKQMEIEVIRAKVVLKNVECARADAIRVKNDMGDTKVILGDSFLCKSDVWIQGGTGNCELMIDKNHPVKVIMLNNGFFTTVNFDGYFKEIEPGVYVNRAYQQSPKVATKIRCTVDFGRLYIVETQ